MLSFHKSTLSVYEVEFPPIKEIVSFLLDFKKHYTKKRSLLLPNFHLHIEIHAFFKTRVAFSFLTSQITDEFITSLHTPTYQHNNHSWQAGRAQHGSCSTLPVIIMISADCWLLWCLRLSSIRRTLCVWAVLIVLTLCPPPPPFLLHTLNGGEA